MNCNEAKSVCLDFLFGDLADAESAAVGEHLAACPQCGQEYAALQRTRGQLNCISEKPVRIDLARLCLRGAEQWERSRRRWRRLGYLTAAAVVLVSVFLSRQIRFEFHDGQMLIAWRNAVQQAPAVEVPPAVSAQPEHLASADYLRLRAKVVEQGADAVFNLDSSDEEPSDTPRSYRALRDQLFNSTDVPSESSI